MKPQFEEKYAKLEIYYFLQKNGSAEYTSSDLDGALVDKIKNEYSFSVDTNVFDYIRMQLKNARNHATSKADGTINFKKIDASKAQSPFLYSIDY